MEPFEVIGALVAALNQIKMLISESDNEMDRRKLEEDQKELQGEINRLKRKVAKLEKRKVDTKKRIGHFSHTQGRWLYPGYEDSINYGVGSHAYKRISKWYSQRHAIDVKNIVNSGRYVDKHGDAIFKYTVYPSVIGHEERIRCYLTKDHKLLASYFNPIRNTWSKWYKI